MEARPSTDQEAAPLLVGSEHGDAHSEAAKGSIWTRFYKGLHEPVNVLTTFLLILCLILLILASVFIGLFAGAQHRINDLKPGEPTTVTSVLTESFTQTKTVEGPTTTVIVAPPPPTHSPLPCLTPECIVLASSIISSLDTSKDPCDSFYNYANGGWLDVHPLPIDKPIYGQFNELAVSNKRVIQSIIELPLPNNPHSPDARTLTKLKDLYASCVNEPLLDKIGAAPLLEVVKTIKHLLDDDFKSPIYKGPGRKYDAPNSSEKEEGGEDEERKVSVEGLTAAVAYLHSRSIDVLFQFGIDGDAGVDPDLMTLQFSQGGTGLPSKEYYEDEDIVKVYTETIAAILLAIDEEASSSTRHWYDRPAQWVTGIASTAWHIATGNPLEQNPQDSVWPPWPWPPWNDPKKDDEKPEERANRLSKSVVEFETRLAEAGLDLDILYGQPFETYNPMNLTDLADALPAIHFPTYFSTFTPRSFPTRLIASYPKYASTLNDIIEDTAYDVVEAYLVARASLELGSHLGTSTRVWKAVRSLQETLQGLKKGVIGDRGEYCLGKVENALGFAAGRFFVQETFGGDSREKAESVIENVIEAFKKSLDKVEWMDEKSAKAAKEKAEAIRIKVGYPTSPNTTSDASIANYYGALKISSEEFFENMLSARAVDNFREWLSLGRRRDFGKWEMIPSEVNAYFNPPENSLVFPAGILRPPFFEKDWPLYMQYGAFGAVAAHELTHAFDSSGRLYNQNGKLEEWWTEKTSKQFDEHAACYSRQYSEYTVEDGKGGVVHLNGNLTLGENLADSGLIQAYRAWKSVSNAKSDFTLPGLDYTQDQLFWISFARIWATKIKPAYAVQRARTDPHSPGLYRVDGTLSNIPAFAEAFSCKKNTKMNPEKRCKLWQ
ncbi:endothelin-converting enzyme [Ceratobasidium sp. AG-Ba]|nr:endothelin-converting enzyme [Ceratobasidium sp. AG-Ba]